MPPFPTTWLRASARRRRKPSPTSRPCEICAAAGSPRRVVADQYAVPVIAAVGRRGLDRNLSPRRVRPSRPHLHATAYCRLPRRHAWLSAAGRCRSPKLHAASTSGPFRRLGVVELHSRKRQSAEKSPWAHWLGRPQIQGADPILHSSLAASVGNSRRHRSICEPHPEHAVGANLTFAGRDF